MHFRESVPIYQQIAERLSDEILAGTYPAEGRIPGVREYSALLEVNVNTTVKAYEQLAREGIIASQRGLGYFVTPAAPQLIRTLRRKRFDEEVLPELFRQMRLLGVSIDQVVAAWQAARAAPQA